MWFTALLGRVAPFKYWIIGGLAIVVALYIGGLKLRIHNLHEEVVQKEAELQTTRVLVLKQRDILVQQNAALKDMNVLLEKCQDLNSKLKVASEESVKKLQGELDRARVKADSNRKLVHESLKGEECSTVAIPGDVAEVLRKGAWAGE